VSYPAFPPYVRYDAGEDVLHKLFQRWLPRRELRVGSSRLVPAAFAGNAYALDAWSGAPVGEAWVAARAGYASAAAVQLIIEEYLRFGQEPPAELLSVAALCWAEDLIRQVPGHPLRSTGGVL
jgi:hypothetical protein